MEGVQLGFQPIPAAGAASKATLISQRSDFRGRRQSFLDFGCGILDLRRDLTGRAGIRAVFRHPKLA